MAYIAANHTFKAHPHPTLMARFKAALKVCKQRKALRALTDDQLADIGLTRPQAKAEYTKPFWQ